VAKSPQPGRAKTRLSPPLSPDQAADVAAASLMDTLEVAIAAVDGQRERVVVAWDGRAEDGRCAAETAELLNGCRVVSQCGATFAERLAAAHADASTQRPGSVVLQIGMDTPQVTAPMLKSAAALLSENSQQAVLGPAVDGGWWLLGLSNPRLAAVLGCVPMSTATTGAQTYSALEQEGATIALTPTLRDVDTWSDAIEVAKECPASRFATTVRAVTP
jgi:glycosyltransferase A (GT-A) superfamily protein (DUF2064 family)